MAKKKPNDLLKAKEKKQKVIAAVGGVIFLALMGIQVPKVLKMMHRDTGPPPVPAAVSTPAVGSPTPSLAAPTLRGEQQQASGSSPQVGASLAATSGGVTQGQLASFSRFVSKDPFAQQVDPLATADSGTSTGSATGLATPRSGSAGGFRGGSGGSSGSAGSETSGSSGGGGSSEGTQPTPTSAVISVNGVLASVTTGTDFPQPSPTNPGATPLFHLVSLTMTTAKISIAGGSYASGAATVTLRVNKPVTLMNTADGTRYKLVLKPQGTAVPASGPSATTTSGTVTVPAPTSP